MIQGLDLFGDAFTIPTLEPKAPRATLRPPKLKTPNETTNLALFDIFEYLERSLSIVPPDHERPTIEEKQSAIELRSTRELVAENDDDENDGGLWDAEIKYSAWGSSWITDANGNKWSKDGCLHLQRMLLNRSLEMLKVDGFAKDKYDVLRWAFAPAMRAVHFVGTNWNVVTRKVHQRDEPFSFHNCCIAAGIDADLLRDGIERNLPEALVARVRENPQDTFA